MVQWHPGLSWVGHRVREAGVYVERLAQRSDLPRVMFSVSAEKDGSSSGLRGYAIAQELRRYGWRTLVIPKQLELGQRRKLIRVERPNVVVLQSAKHALNRPKYYGESICVFDIDDADFLAPHLVDGTIECIINAAGVIAGSTYVANFARRFNSRVELIWTSSSPTDAKVTSKLKPPVVAFAPANIDWYPNECDFIKSVLSEIRINDWQFWLFGANVAATAQQMFGDLQSRGICCRFYAPMSYRKFLKKMSAVSIGLAPIVPSNAPHIVGKSFGKILSYLSCRAVTVATDFADHGLFFRNGRNGYLATSAGEFAEHVERLLLDGDLREQIAERAYGDYVDQLSTQAAARKADLFIRDLLVV